MRAEIISVPEGQLRLDKEGNEEEIGTGEIVAVVGSSRLVGAIAHAELWEANRWEVVPQETGIPQQK